MERFPIMSITIAVVNNAAAQFPSSHVIAERAAELKKYLKRFQGSNYLSERRSAREKDTTPQQTAAPPVPTPQRLGSGR
jgi:hypothetical protein